MLFFAFADKSPPVTSGKTDFPSLILLNLPFIEKTCRRVVSRNDYGESSVNDINQDNEADELLNEVLDHLKADNFKPLREFQGKAKLTTYLTTIISNLIIDLVRLKKGRSRARERAREMGSVAEKLYELVYGRGYSLADAHGHLETTFGISEPLEKLRELLDAMRGREKGLSFAADGDGAWLIPGKEMLVDDEVEIVVADPMRSAEEMLADDQRERLSRQVLNGVLEEISGEERFILSLRFPTDDVEEPKGNREIAEILGLTEKAVDNRIRRILTRCREKILSQGLSLGDLIDAWK